MRHKRSRSVAVGAVSTSRGASPPRLSTRSPICKRTKARSWQLADWIRGHWSIEDKIHWVRDVTYDEDRSQIRAGTGHQVMAALRNAAIGALRMAGITNIAATPATPTAHWPYSASPNDFAGTVASGALLRSLRRRGPATVGERRYAEALRGSRAPRMRSRPKMNSSAGS